MLILTYLTSYIYIQSIVYGNPAKHIKYRFDSEDIRNELLRIKWWEWDEEIIDDNMDLFLSDLAPEDFVARSNNINNMYLEKCKARA